MTPPTSIVGIMNMTAGYSSEEIGLFFPFNHPSLQFSFQIERVIDEFYSPTSHLTTGQRQQLNSILEDFQQSKLAWDLSWRLLDVNKPISVQFFSAVVLCNKISKHLYVSFIEPFFLDIPMDI